MAEINEIARQYLASGAVDVIIGYEATGERSTRPCFISTPEEADRLVFNHYCLNNLAVYLTRQKRPAGKKIGIVLKGCDLRAANMLIQEGQIERDAIVIIGVNCNGAVKDFGMAWETGNLATKCIHCQLREPAFVDAVAGAKEEMSKPEDAHGAWLQEVESLNADQRFEFWSKEFDKCLKCYACRQICPLCYCEQCIADKSIPRWIESSATPRGNFSWNLIRAFHLSGRCIGCNECERACPVDIPLGLLNRKMGMTARQEFGYMPGVDPSAPTLVGSYDPSDLEQFIM